MGAKSMEIPLNKEKEPRKYRATSIPMSDYLFLPNFSCHFPLADGADGAAAAVWGTSSIVWCSVAMAERPNSGGPVSNVLSSVLTVVLLVVGDSSMSALDVFFCRSEYVFPVPSAAVVARSAEVGEGFRVRLFSLESETGKTG